MTGHRYGRIRCGLPRCRVADRMRNVTHTLRQVVWAADSVRFLRRPEVFGDSFHPSFGIWSSSVPDVSFSHSIDFESLTNLHFLIGDLILTSFSPRKPEVICISD